MIRRPGAPLLAALLLLVSLLWSSAAFAQDSIAVMKFEPIGEVPPEVMEGLTEGIKDAVRKSGMTLSSQGGDVMLADVEFILEDCDVTQADCLDRVAEMFNAQHIVYGAVVANGPTTLIWHTRGEATQRELTDTVSTRDAAVALGRRLIAGETGKIAVSSGAEPGAEVVIDDAPVGLTPYEAEVPVGRHTVQVRKVGFLDSSTRTVEVRQGEVATVEFELAADPNFAVDKEMSTMTKVGWALTGIGGAALIGATVTSVLVGSEEDELEKLVAEERYEEANDVADKGETLALTSNILWGTGGALLATGLTLVILGYTEDSETAATASGFDFDVMVGGDGAIGRVGYTF